MGTIPFLDPRTKKKKKKRSRQNDLIRSPLTIMSGFVFFVVAKFYVCVGTRHRFLLPAAFYYWSNTMQSEQAF